MYVLFCVHGVLEFSNSNNNNNQSIESNSLYSISIVYFTIYKYSICSIIYVGLLVYVLFARRKFWLKCIICIILHTCCKPHIFIQNKKNVKTLFFFISFYYYYNCYCYICFNLIHCRCFVAGHTFFNIGQCLQLN